MRPQAGGLLRGWGQPHGHRGLHLAHVLECLALYFWRIAWLTLPAVLRKNERVHREYAAAGTPHARRARCVRRGISQGSVYGLARMHSWTGSG